MGRYSKFRIVETDRFYIQYRNSLFGWMYLYDLNKATGGLVVSAMLYIILFISIIVGAFIGNKIFFYIIFSLLFLNSILFVISRFWRKYKFSDEKAAKKYIDNRIDEKEKTAIENEKREAERQKMKEKKKTKRYVYLDPKDERRDKLIKLSK